MPSGLNLNKPTGAILLIPDFHPEITEIVPSCFCSAAAGTVTITQPNKSPLVPDKAPGAGDDYGSTTPRITSVISFLGETGAMITGTLTSLNSNQISLTFTPIDNVKV